MLSTTVAVVSATDAKDFKVKPDQLFFCRTTNYATTIHVWFYDADKNELPLLEEDRGHCSSDQSIKNLAADKLEHGAYYMTVYMKPYAKGTSSKTFTMVPIQAAYFDFSGLLGSTAKLKWKFADGSCGQYNWA
ncbi:MAG: hypothetical protein LBT10_01320 [Methanobrevibacter sp.]|nr:hypothetical protein [Methanobrevibacter sp.]